MDPGSVTALGAVTMGPCGGAQRSNHGDSRVPEATDLKEETEELGEYCMHNEMVHLGSQCRPDLPVQLTYLIITHPDRRTTFDSWPAPFRNQPDTDNKTYTRFTPLAMPRHTQPHEIP